MKLALFLPRFLLFVCVLDARRSCRSRYDEMLDSKVPSKRLLTFISMLSGNFTQVGPSINVTQPGLDSPFTAIFIPFEVPVLKPAKTFLSFGIVNSMIRQRILAVTERDDLIYITFYFNLRVSTERHISQDLFDEEDFTDLTLQDLKKRCDCTRVFVQQGPLDFRGNWQPCQQTGPSFPNYQRRLTCTSFSVIGRREFQREGQLPGVCRNRRRIRI